MDLVFLNELLNAPWTQAIAWTLFHSVWVGTVAAVVSGVIIVTTKRCRASLRYSLHASVFMLFLIAMTYTFVMQLKTAVVPQPSRGRPEHLTGILHPAPDIVSEAAFNGVNTSFVVGRINYFLSEFSAEIVFAWLLVFCFRFCSIVVGMHNICRLRKQESSPASSDWKHKLDVLACKIGITRHLALLESRKITVPMVIGYFKPVIVIPLGLVCRLPVKEMEAILLHELAHIRRRDYLINILQTIAENIFFFHPCIHWISSLIREERENCCDDIAVEVTNDREQYVHALISFQEYNLAASAAPAIAFAGTRHRLLDRVRRLLNHENKKLNQMEKMILMGSMVVLTSICVISTNDSQAQQRERPHRESFRREAPSENRRELREREELLLSDGALRHISTNTSFIDGDRITTIIAVDEDGRKYTLKNVNGKTESLSINGEAIDEEELDEYKTVIKKIEKGSAGAGEKARLQRQKVEEKRMESEALRESRMEDRRHREQEMALKDEQDKEEAEKLMYKQREQEERHMRNLEQMERNEVLKAKQHELRESLEKQTAEKAYRNRNNRQHREERNLNESLRRKSNEADPDEYKQQLREKELSHQAEQDAVHKKSDQHRMYEMGESARQMQEREADRVAQYRKRQQLQYYNQAQRNREIHERNLERIAQQQKAQDLYLQQLPRRKADSQLKYHANPMPKPDHFVPAKPERLPEPKPLPERNNEINGIIEVLEEEEIIDSRDRLSFTLTEDHLIVNGRKQSPEVHERLKDRYIHKRGDHFSYFKDGNTTRTTIERN